MQRLLVIFALGLGLLMPGCAVQDLPFSGGSESHDTAAPTPYQPQAGAVHDGSAEGHGSDYVPQTIPAHQIPMPAGVDASPQQGTNQGANQGVNQGANQGQNHNANQSQGMAGGQHAPAAKPVTRSASGLQEREL